MTWLKNFSPGQKIVPEKKKICPRKILNFCPRKKKSPREKIRKFARENFKVPEIFFFKWARKQFPPEKKTQKSTKNRFLGHFSFSREKKKTLRRGKWGRKYFVILHHINSSLLVNHTCFFSLHQY